MLAFILFLPLFAATAVYCVFLTGKDLRKRFAAKAVCSAMFTLIGIVFFALSENSLPKTLVLIGLFLGAIGDIVLETGNFHQDKYKVFFVSGGGSFLLGHFFYIAALLISVFKLKETGRTGFLPQSVSNLTILPVLLSIVFFLIFVSVSHRFNLRAVEGGKAFRFAIGGYLSVVAAAGAIAVSCALCVSARVFITYSCGFVLFLISDSTLMKNMFGPKRTILYDHIIITSYYFAQFALALSIYIRL